MKQLRKFQEVTTDYRKADVLSAQYTFSTIKINLHFISMNKYTPLEKYLFSFY